MNPTSFPSYRINLPDISILGLMSCRQFASAPFECPHFIDTWAYYRTAASDAGSGGGAVNARALCGRLDDRDVDVCIEDIVAATNGGGNVFWPRNTRDIALKYPRETRILRVLVYRMQLIDTLFAHTSSESSELIYQLTVWMHAHFPLISYIERNAASGDVALVFDEHIVNVVANPAHPARICADRVFCEDRLADLTLFLPFNNTTWTIRKRQSGTAQLLWKAAPNRCRGRRLPDIFRNIVKRDQVAFTLVMNMIVCSVLGLYRTSRYRLSYVTRRRIYAMLLDGTKDCASVVDWLIDPNANHQNLLIFSIRQYLCYAVRKVPAIAYAVTGAKGWHRFETSVFNGIEAMRRHIDETVMTHLAGGQARLFDDFAGTEALLEAMRISRGGIRVRKPRRIFLETMHKACERAVLKLYEAYLEETDRESNGVPLFIGAASGSALHECLRIIDARLVNEPMSSQSELVGSLVREAVYRFKPCDTMFSLYILESFNISPSSTTCMRFLFDAYNKHGVIKDANNTLFQIARHAPYDFFLIRHYFVALREAVGICTHRLPAHMAAAQLVALRSRCGFGARAALPSAVTKLGICPNCYSIKNYVITSRVKAFTYVFGCTDSYVCPSTRVMVCRPRRQRTPPKQKSKKPKDGALAVRALTVIKELAREKCELTPIRWIEMEGTLLTLFDTQIFICPVCGNFTEYHPYNHRGHYRSCKICAATKHRPPVAFNDWTLRVSAQRTRGIPQRPSELLAARAAREERMRRNLIVCKNGASAPADDPVVKCGYEHCDVKARASKKPWSEVRVRLTSYQDTEVDEQSLLTDMVGTCKTIALCPKHARYWIVNFEQRYDLPIPLWYMERGIARNWKEAQDVQGALPDFRFVVV